MRTIAQIADRCVEAAGEAGGIDEVRRIAEHGWPTHRELHTDAADGDVDDVALRAAIQERAREVVAAE